MKNSTDLIILIGSVIAALGGIGTAIWWLVWPRLIVKIQEDLQPMKDQVAETHKQVTENHHSNEQPTLLDILADLRQDFRDGIDRVDKRLDDHLLLASRSDADMWRAIEAVAKGQPPEGL